MIITAKYFLGNSNTEVKKGDIVRIDTRTPSGLRIVRKGRIMALSGDKVTLDMLDIHSSKNQKDTRTFNFADIYFIKIFDEGGQ